MHKCNVDLLIPPVSPTPALSVINNSRLTHGGPGRVRRWKPLGALNRRSGLTGASGMALIRHFLVPAKPTRLFSLPFTSQQVLKSLTYSYDNNQTLLPLTAHLSPPQLLTPPPRPTPRVRNTHPFTLNLTSSCCLPSPPQQLFSVSVFGLYPSVNALPRPAIPLLTS